MFDIYECNDSLYLIENEQQVCICFAKRSPEGTNIIFFNEPITDKDCIVYTFDGIKPSTIAYFENDFPQGNAKPFDILPNDQDNFMSATLKMITYIHAIALMDYFIKNKCANDLLKKRISEFMKFIPLLREWHKYLSDDTIDEALQQQLAAHNNFIHSFYRINLSTYSWLPISESSLALLRKSEQLVAEIKKHLTARDSILTAINSLPYQPLIKIFTIIERFRFPQGELEAYDVQLNSFKTLLTLYIMEHGVYLINIDDKIFLEIFIELLIKNNDDITKEIKQLPWVKLFPENLQTILSAEPQAIAPKNPQIQKENPAFFEDPVPETLAGICNFLLLPDLMRFSQTSHIIRNNILDYLNHSNLYSLVKNITKYSSFFKIADKGDIYKFTTQLILYPQEFLKLEEDCELIFKLFLTRYLKNNFSSIILTSVEKKNRVDEALYKIISILRSFYPGWNIYFQKDTTTNSSNKLLLTLYRVVAYYKVFGNRKEYQTPLYKLTQAHFASDIIMDKEYLIPITLLIKNCEAPKELADFVECLLATMSVNPMVSPTHHPLYVAALYDKAEIVRFLLKKMPAPVTNATSAVQTIYLAYILLKFCINTEDRPEWFDDFFKNNQEYLRQIFPSASHWISLKHSKHKFSQILRIKTIENMPPSLTPYTETDTLTDLFFSECDDAMAKNLSDKIPLTQGILDKFFCYQQWYRLLKYPAFRAIYIESFKNYISHKCTTSLDWEIVKFLKALTPTLDELVIFAQQASFQTRKPGLNAAINIANKIAAKESISDELSKIENYEIYHYLCNLICRGYLSTDWPQYFYNAAEALKISSNAIIDMRILVSYHSTIQGWDDVIMHIVFFLYSTNPTSFYQKDPAVFQTPLFTFLERLKIKNKKQLEQFIAIGLKFESLKPAFTQAIKLFLTHSDNAMEIIFHKNSVKGCVDYLRKTLQELENKNSVPAQKRKRNERDAFLPATQDNTETIDIDDNTEECETVFIMNHIMK